MSEESTQFVLGDAALDAVSGKPPRRGIFGRRKKTKAEPPPLTHCENCGAALIGAYCAQCGQHAIDYRRSLVAVMLDAADSFFNTEPSVIRQRFNV